MNSSRFSFIRTSKTYLPQYDVLLEKVYAYSVWPEFILQDKVNIRYWEDLYVDFPLYQFFLIDGQEVVGNGNCVPLSLTEDELNDLPEEGWDWALERAFLDKQAGKKPTVLCALQMGINPAYQGQGISNQLIGFMKAIAKEQQLDTFILPLRPNKKHQYPLQSMEQYIQWTNKEGWPFDPWIRTHCKNGAEVVKVCTKAMLVEGSVQEWEQWTNHSFQASGQYIIDFALNPIEINIERNIGTYVEPNVWMRYNVR
ncbi:GNAT family N-acetyltransferase [Myroides sp. WP-1]|uniref:GNAT family N-acetyltransferase n=1 Tax=Myroides sp. WP-1 TaxID=2759944 RepID=UPI0015FCFA34|nr:GNAT family N-acetyltransferase [Myroides sp. WP-1]MBB1138059.1 GNAT family N-acetyltransferase [Myroides sp. WP-1]